MTLPTHTGVLQQFDPLTHRRTALVDPVDAESIAASDESLWTRAGDTVTQRDDSGRVVNRVRHISAALGLEGQRSIVADDDGAWSSGSPTGSSIGSRAGTSSSGSASAGSAGGSRGRGPPWG